MEAIQYLEDLGSGYFLAMHDLEIRGAGEILGDQQSGEIHEIGFSMYLKMLNRAVEHLKNNETLVLKEIGKFKKDLIAKNPNACDSI